MEYIGLDKQIRKNNFNSILLLIAFPALLLGMLYALIYFLQSEHNADPNLLFLQAMPFVLGGVGIWFLIAWAGHAAFIRMATGSKPWRELKIKECTILSRTLRYHRE